MTIYIEFLLHHWALFSLLIVVVVSILIFELYALRLNPRKVTPEALVQFMNSDQGVVLDVRASNAFKSGHIIHSVHIPADELEKSSQLKSYKKKSLVIVHEDEPRALRAANQLNCLGFANVKVLGGGIRSWKEADLPLETDKK
ncbi:MAG: rhodanese-like domain-containing protein [Gammaproteobacteria bacterium]|nr:rhodanese-like domain-containing protein [Gammaproteobacteria bacterium]MBU1558648.1 rhodanese-like domain-containing protein [Gammaproteobacteria bacterium]MBU1926838.1 rhodanese-like domain-containing protein [Gammaproteobacteria bacterium]MBU2546165.1 rhodanese-like domain-containing protein [Gammaproteobacteria bacterium]